jgi:cell division protein FtsZ
MQGAGSALMGIGSARGTDRSVAAAEAAIASPLLEASMDGAHGVLLSVAGGSDLGLFEINEAAQLVADAAHPDANIIFGAVIDDALGDEVRVTVIAAGFDGGAPAYKRFEPRRAARPQAEPEPEEEIDLEPEIDLVETRREPTRAAEPVYAATPERPRRTVVFEDDLDVPDFLK